jgi:hypothetical protein
MSVDEWLEALKTLEGSLQGDAELKLPPLSKLADYYNHLAELAILVQDVVRGAAMEPGSAGDLARVQRPFRTVQRAQDLGCGDHRAHRLTEIAPAEIAGNGPRTSRPGRLRFQAP